MKINEDYVVGWEYEHGKNILTIKVIDSTGELFDYIQEKTDDEKHRMHNYEKWYQGLCLCDMCKKHNDGICIKNNN